MEISRSKRRWLKGSTVVAICATIFAPSIADADNFPDVDQSKLLITLQRTACLGSCPDYVVSIDGNGHVTFSTSGEPMDAVSGFHRKMSPSRGILYPGRHNDQIDTATVQSLLQQFRKAHFSELHDKYRARITDNPTYVLTIRTGHGSKHVVDYAGGQAGMPASVVDLEDAVDRVAGTSRWVSGAEGLVEWLSKTGFDFHSQEAAYIAVNGMANADEETLIELVDRGAPLDLILDGSNDDGAPVGAELLTGSIQYGRTKLFRKLVAAGWLKRLRPGDGSAAFADGAAGCSPSLVDAAADAGLSIKTVARQGNEANSEGDHTFGDTALAKLATSYNCKDEATRLATADRLLARGLDPNMINSKGETAIFGIENVDLLDLLLAHGADATIVDKEGNSAVFDSWTDAIVLRLLKAGASPCGHYFDGLNLPEQMKNRPMPNTARWLANQAMKGASASRCSVR